MNDRAKYPFLESQQTGINFRQALSVQEIFHCAHCLGLYQTFICTQKGIFPLLTLGCGAMKDSASEEGSVRLERFHLDIGVPSSMALVFSDLSVGVVLVVVFTKVNAAARRLHRLRCLGLLGKQVNGAATGGL